MSPEHRRWAVARPFVTVVLVALTCVACGSSSRPEEAPSSPGASSEPPSAPGPRSSPPRTPSEYRGRVVAGTVTTAGASGCVELVAADTGVRFALLGPVADSLADGSSIKLRGTPAPQHTDRCAGAIPLTVTALLPDAAS